jgi:hypothetical protein
VGALAIQEIAGITAVHRPDAPYDLTPEQVDIWHGVVQAMPADWFGRESQDVLTQYCRHVVAARHVARMINTLETMIEKEVEAAEGQDAKTGVLILAVKTLDRLLKIQEREGRAIASLATRMRLTQHSTYSRDKTRAVATKKPWES